jgi:hypothetical protein
MLRIQSTHVTLANWYELFYNLNAMTWNQLAPDAHSALLGHKGLIAAILRTRTYQHLASSHHQSNASEEDVADDNDLAPTEQAALPAEDGYVQRSAGLFEAEDSLHAPASQGQHVFHASLHQCSRPFTLQRSSNGLPSPQEAHLVASKGDFGGSQMAD